MPRLDPEDVIVRILHNYGEIETPLTEWMRVGPGPRWGLAPYAAYHRITGKRVSLRQVPLAYRNNGLSRALIRLGWLEDPWGRQ